MTTKIVVLLFTTLAVAKSCDKADFETPQPTGAKNLTNVPTKLHGKYVSLEDSSVLRINDRSIIRDKTANYTMHRSELDEKERLKVKHDTTFYEDNMHISLRLFGDSIKAKIDYVDTLIYISDYGVIKYANDYFLSKRNSKQKWEVTKLTLNRKELVISSTFTKEDVAALRKQLKTSDTTLVFNPTKIQFKKFVKEGGFRNQEKFKRQ
ncbi:hypothetical protein BH10BAC4_BH10BAC4_21930 [soil metagenome]